ncbi:hypothetical protein I4U23_016265 [Adineta vaga]|nr:hypothetical protein I4U23_016265 [Adineta vaga]
MIKWTRIKLILKRFFQCLFLTWLLAVFVGFIFAFLPRQENKQDAVIGFTDTASSANLTINYRTDIQSNDSLIVSDPSQLANQIAKAYSVSHNMVRVFSARFTKSLILTRRRRDATSSTNDATNNTSYMLVIDFQVDYPRTCGGVTYI